MEADMLRRNVLASIVVVLVFAAGYIAGNINSLQSVAYAQSQTRVFELRTYTAHDGKLDNVLNRFRDHTMKMFARHGMVNVGYWTPEDAPLAKNTLIYILAHPSREAAQKNWDAFRSDTDWKSAKAASEANGPIVEKTSSVFMDATSFSPMK
jgi:hypothetical protein